jgi:hypothetical protein
MSTDDRMQSPSTARNAEPVFDVLSRFLPPSGTILEVASGSGEHGALFAPRLPHLTWQPSDKDPDALNSIEAWRQHVGVENLLPPLEIDLLAVEAGLMPPIEDVAGMINMNMIHISPWQACETLLQLAGNSLPVGGYLYLYGPYRRNGQHTAQSNVDFDAWLKSQDASWGVRNLEDVEATAKTNNLLIEEITDMPSNNYSVIFRRQQD